MTEYIYFLKDFLIKNVFLIFFVFLYSILASMILASISEYFIRRFIRLNEPDIWIKYTSVRFPLFNFGKFSLPSAKTRFDFYDWVLSNDAKKSIEKFKGLKLLWFIRKTSILFFKLLIFFCVVIGVWTAPTRGELKNTSHLQSISFILTEY